jgi:hypothetical protein
MRATLIFDVLQDESFTGNAIPWSLWALVMVICYFVAAGAFAATFFPETWLGRRGIRQQRQLTGRYVGTPAFALTPRRG